MIRTNKQASLDIYDSTLHYSLGMVSDSEFTAPCEFQKSSIL